MLYAESSPRSSSADIASGVVLTWNTRWMRSSCSRVEAAYSPAASAICDSNSLTRDAEKSNYAFAARNLEIARVTGASPAGISRFSIMRAMRAVGNAAFTRPFMRST